MVKRRSKPNLSFEPVSTGRVHLVKERDGKGAITTKCGVIVDTKARQPVRTTIWNDYDCPRCLELRPLQGPERPARRGVKRRSAMGR